MFYLQVIIFDSDWNPQCDLQAQDRVHRIGQTRPVIVYRFITNGTVESYLLEKANNKRKLEKLVIHKEQFKGDKVYYRSNKELSLEDLQDVYLESYAELGRSDEKGLSLITDATLNPFTILTQEDVDKIMDRSPKAYGEASANVSKKFLAVVNAPDELNNILV
jgi:ATP-dependent DNA helicase